MAIPPLGTFLGPDVTLLDGNESWICVHLSPDGSRRILSRWGCSGSGWAGHMKPLILAKGLPAVTWSSSSVVTFGEIKVGEYLPLPACRWHRYPIHSRPGEPDTLPC